MGATFPSSLEHLTNLLREALSVGMGGAMVCPRLPGIFRSFITRNGHSGGAARMRLLDTLVAMEMPTYV
jgi:hypothetical protein